ncbi:Verru_Chthon cassette protein B [Phragmitibacter flavus]|uniref:Verru_Chthon cassette protein B n=1 Tax=Phragmitibacter flavus TaxID=2576071 RepID=A0A5R8KEE7_9BACT|nr:Verru_Chthon cassette protein B [Phragmitibacter flavus]
MKTKTRKSQGFTLAETALSVGLASSVVAALVGLIPVSLNTLREAGARTAEARIAQFVAADYRMRDWQEVLNQRQSSESEDFFFDGQGMRLENDAADRIFTARVAVADAEPLPGAENWGSNPKLKALQILVTDRMNAEQAFATPELCRSTQVLLAQTDKLPSTSPTP